MSITPWTIYWITRLDGINEVCAAFVFIAGVVAFGAGFGWVITTAIEEGGHAAVFSRVAKWAVSIFSASIVLYTLVPTTKEAAAIIAIPAVVNSKFVNTTLPTEARVVYDLAKSWLFEKVGDQKPEAEKESK